uniref:tRNA N(3)-cytidine methyltransferase n=1 Tax=Denticeps clupeoides TaxID=299321 RepID=A0AAY4CCP4_9TELE
MRPLLGRSLVAVARGTHLGPCRLGHRGRPAAPLGSRILTQPEHVFRHNMWYVPVKRTQTHHVGKMSYPREFLSGLSDKYDRDAHKFWDDFYGMHQNKFFKDRRWLFLEFPELLPPNPDCGAARAGQSGSNESAEAAGSSFRILEVGCGAGNSVFPIITSIRDGRAFLYCCDFSPRAVQLVKHPDYDPSLCHAFVQDVCEETASFPFPPCSLDVILAVFVLSSIRPERVQSVLHRLAQHLKPGGIFLFRDYGRHDLSQLRFKKGQCLSDNFYARQDGTCVYFFTADEVRRLFTSAGLTELQNLEDRRLQVNRGKKVVMRRVWMQAKFQKPQTTPTDVTHQP